MKAGGAATQNKISLLWHPSQSSQLSLWGILLPDGNSFKLEGLAAHQGRCDETKRRLKRTSLMFAKSSVWNVSSDYRVVHYNLEVGVLSHVWWQKWFRYKETVFGCFWLLLYALQIQVFKKTPTPNFKSSFKTSVFTPRSFFSPWKYINSISITPEIIRQSSAPQTTAWSSLTDMHLPIIKGGRYILLISSFCCMASIKEHLFYFE